MNQDDQKMIAITARMEGEQTVVSAIGKKVKVSQMELVCLVNFAEIGLMSVFAGLEGAMGDEASADLNKTLQAIRVAFGKNGADDGLSRLSQSAAALLRSEKFSKYLARN